MQLGVIDARGFGMKHRYALVAVQRRYGGKHEEDDTQTPYPLHQRPPKQDAPFQPVNVGINTCARGGEARDCLEESVGEAERRRTHDKRYQPYDTEDYPHQRREGKAFASPNAQTNAPRSQLRKRKNRQCRRRSHRKAGPVGFAAKQSHRKRDAEQQPLDAYQTAHDAGHRLIV